MKWQVLLEKVLLKLWYNPPKLAYLFTPLSLLFYSISGLRRYTYRLPLLKPIPMQVPVIVVGNITVGGSGKTPLVIWLADFLQRQGYRPGIISRGYGGKALPMAYRVTADSDPRIVGDEPIILAKRTQCPVAVAKKRTLAAQYLLATTDCNIIISDDGLQHYALPRAIEIVVIDGARTLGNGLLLPAGPLREPATRLNSVDFVVVNGVSTMTGYSKMQLRPLALVNLCNANLQCNISEFTGQIIHAIAGIGNPSRFFQQLRQLGLNIIEHPFPDHHCFSESDLNFMPKELPIIMTEKDAVKCYPFAKPNSWYLPVSAELSNEFSASLCEKLQEV